MALLLPGVPTAMFGLFDAEVELRGRIALSPLADAIKKQAKINASNGIHRWGTKTPAIPGTGPAKISQTLWRSIDRSEVTREAFGWFCQVGMKAGTYPGYSANSGWRKAASQYAYILEVSGCRNGARYPFLYYAFEWGVTTQADILYRAAYGSNWARLI